MICKINGFAGTSGWVIPIEYYTLTYLIISFTYIYIFHLHIRRSYISKDHNEESWHFSFFGWHKYCCIRCTAPRHYLSQYWRIVDWTPKNKLQWKHENTRCQYKGCQTSRSSSSLGCWPRHSVMGHIQGHVPPRKSVPPIPYGCPEVIFCNSLFIPHMPCY